MLYVLFLFKRMYFRYSQLLRTNKEKELLITKSEGFKCEQLIVV